MTSSNGNIFRVTGHLCGEFTSHRWIPPQRPVTWSFDIFFDLRVNKPLSKQSWGWGFEMLLRPLWSHSNAYTSMHGLEWWTDYAITRGLFWCLFPDWRSNKVTWWRHQMETFSALLALCVGNSPVTGEFPHKGQWREALIFSLICVWINRWVNNREAGDLRCYCAHYEVTVMPTHQCMDLSGELIMLSQEGYFGVYFPTWEAIR